MKVRSGENRYSAEIILKWVGLGQPVFYVGEDIVAVFEAYGDPDEAWADAYGRAFFGCEFGVGGAGGVGGDTAGIAEVGGEGQQFQAV